MKHVFVSVQLIRGQDSFPTTARLLSARSISADLPEQTTNASSGTMAMVTHDEQAFVIALSTQKSSELRLSDLRLGAAASCRRRTASGATSSSCIRRSNPEWRSRKLVPRQGPIVTVTSPVGGGTRTGSWLILRRCLPLNVGERMMLWKKTVERRWAMARSRSVSRSNRVQKKRC